MGLIVNPVAGAGGVLGRKGSDALGPYLPHDGEGVSRASYRARRALKAFYQANGRCHVATGRGTLGGDLVPDAEIVGPEALTGTAADTDVLTGDMQEKVDLILFCGGDGTACDVARRNDGMVPMLGIPAGVKMHSGVFARSPEYAGRAAAAFLSARTPAVEMVEVLDLDEAARDAGKLSAELFAIVPTPRLAGIRQNPKAASVDSDADLHAGLRRYVNEMTPGTNYIVGPGTTMATLLERLGGGSLLGVDLVRDGRIVARDLSEEALLEALGDGRPARIVLSIVGGQGFLFGRGNQQISERVIRRVGTDRIDILCSAAKLSALIPLELTVDTGDPELDAELAGYRQVLVAAGRRQIVRVVH